MSPRSLALLALAAACGRAPPAPPALRRDTLARTRTLVRRATVTRAEGTPVAIGDPCRFVVQVGHAPGRGALDLLVRGRCGEVEVFAPTDVDLGTGALLETGLRRCALSPSTPDGGPTTWALRCAAPTGPPGSRSHDLTVEGTTARVRRRWRPQGVVDLAWSPESEPDDATTAP